MDEISRYIIRSADTLMSDVERRAYRAFFIKRKADALKGTRLANYFDDASLHDPQVRALVDMGFDSFIETVRDRVMREDHEKHYLNHCPRCGALARTATAKQCPKCFFSWH